jgi:hypothetical protein
MSNKMIEIGVIVGAAVVGFTAAIALFDGSKKQPDGHRVDGEMVDGDRYYDAEGDSGNRFSTYGRRDREGSITTSMPLNLGGKRSKRNKKNKKQTKKRR